MLLKTCWHGSNHGSLEEEWRSYHRKAGFLQTSDPDVERLESETKEMTHWMPMIFQKLLWKQMRRGRWPRLSSGPLQLMLLVMLFSAQSSMAAFIAFENCLDPSIINSNNPKNLQFVPLFVWASFNSSLGGNGINVTAFGNIAGIATQQPYPDISDTSYWQNPNKTDGKIPDVAGTPGQEKYTTFTTQFNVLDYTPYNPPATRFCNSSAITACPLAPVFNFSGDS